MRVAEVVEEISKDQVFYDQSSGGATFSGGEPLMQHRFLLALLETCGNLGIHRAVDTSGFVSEGVLLEVASHTDLFLYDLKHMDPDKHREFTGVSNTKIISNLLLLAGSDADINVRVPLIGGFNTDDDNVCKTAIFLVSLPKSCDISLLPFHKRAEDKHRRFGMDYGFPNGAELPEGRVSEIQGILLDYGLSARIGG
jgi:pyruvate formate lyase activating enzyme